MEFQEVVRRRRMVRNFDPDRPVPPEVRERLLANALRGPSAGYSQGFEFLVVETAAERELFWRESCPPEEDEGDPYAEGLRKATLIIVPLSHRDAYLDRYALPDKGWDDRDESRWPVPYWDIDTGFAALLMLLTAVDEDLGACFFGLVPPRIPPFRAAFGVPDALVPIGAVAIGYRAADEHPPKRMGRPARALKDVVHRGSW